MKVLAVDDHPLILSALELVLAELFDEVELIGVSTSDEARKLLRSQRNFGLMLLELRLRDGQGMALLNEVIHRDPDLPVVILSGSDRASDVVLAIDAGAAGYVPKRASNELLLEALQVVMAGGVYFPPLRSHLYFGPAGAERAQFQGEAGVLGPVSAAATSAVVGRVEEELPSVATSPRSVRAATSRANSFEALGLTPRQCEVLTLLMQGKANKVIARDLGLSVETVKDHVAAVLRCLGVASRMQAVLAVGQWAVPMGAMRRRA